MKVGSIPESVNLFLYWPFPDWTLSLGTPLSCDSVIEKMGLGLFFIWAHCPLERSLTRKGRIQFFLLKGLPLHRQALH